MSLVLKLEFLSIGPEVSTKEDIETRIKEFLREQPEEELSMISCLMIHSCNKPREKVCNCTAVRHFYLLQKTMNIF